MSKTLENPRALFVDNSGIQSLGALEFYNGDTDTLQSVYYDRGLTSLAPNPVLIDANGIAPQVWGNVYYKVKQYRRINDTACIFPDDYTFVREWFWDASTVSSTGGSFSTVSTMAELKALSPVDGDKVTILGYYSVGDARIRTFVFNASSVDTPNDGNRVRPNGYGSGCWEENSGAYIDARDFGCMHPTLATNGNIAQAVSYCNAENIELKFPAGVYNVTGATVSPLCPITVEAGAFFNVQGVSVFTLAPQGNWSLPYQTQIGTTQYFLVDLTGSDYVDPNGASLQWWNATTLARIGQAFSKCGASGIGIHGTVIVPDDGGSFTGYILSRLVFHEDAVLQINASAGTFEFEVNSIEFLGSSQVGSFTGNYSTSLTINGKIKSSWFESSGNTSYNIASVVGANSIIYIDNRIVCNDTANLGKVSSDGGYIDVTSGIVVTIEVTGSGEKFIAINHASGLISGCSDARAYYLTTANQVTGFIRSSHYGTQSVCDFQGLTTTPNISITGSYKISNWNHSGTFDCDTIDLQNCNFTNGVTTNAILAIGCRFTDLLCGVNGANQVDMVLKSCVVYGTIEFLTVSGDTIRRLIAENCTNLGTNTPIDVTNLLASSFASGGYVSVRNNTPECFDDSSVPTGAWAQSYIDTHISVTGSSQTATYSLAGKAWALVLPNINMNSLGLLTSNKTTATTPVYYDAYASGSSLIIGSTLAFSGSPRSIRVSGNLY